MHKSVLVAIFDETGEKILLTKRRDIPVWVFPGGKVEEDETPKECAVRECCEETGYHVEIVRAIAEYSPLNRLSHHTHFFEAKITGGQPKISDETQELEFFDPQKPPYPLPPPYEIMLQHALAKGPTRKEPVPNSAYGILLKSMLKRPDLILRFLLMKLGIHTNTSR